jgi:hypothetical protein
VNDFKRDLEWSFDERENEMFDRFYFRAFPDLERIEVATAMKDQRAGIDKILHTNSGNSIRIDEKKRRKDYGDILLEAYSVIPKNGGPKTVGWLGRHKHTDYIVYAIMPSRKVYLFPFLLLQKAWLCNYAEWKQSFGIKYADNGTYLTSNIAVPKDILFAAISKEMDQDFYDQ